MANRSGTPKGPITSNGMRTATRRRQSVKDSAEVLEQARRKAIELDASKAGMEIAETEEGSRVRVRDAVAAYLS